MDKEQIKSIIDFSKIREVTFKDSSGDEIKRDYLFDEDGNNIIPLTPLEIKLIQEISDLKVRIQELESKIK